MTKTFLKKFLIIIACVFVTTLLLVVVLKVAVQPTPSKQTSPSTTQLTKSGEKTKKPASPTPLSSDPHYTSYKLMEDVAHRAKQEGVMKTETSTTYNEYGEEEYTVTSQITDQKQFEKILKETIKEHIRNPSSELDLSYALFEKSLLEGETDINKLMNQASGKNWLWLKLQWVIKEYYL